MARWLPVWVLAISSLGLFAWSRTTPQLNEVLFQLSPVMLIATALGAVARLVSALNSLGPTAATALGTSIEILGGYSLPYVAAGFLAWTKRFRNITLGTAFPLVLFVAPHFRWPDSVVSLLGFACALPLLWAFYYLGVWLRFVAIKSMARPNNRWRVP